MPPPPEISADVLALGVLIVALVLLLVVAFSVPIGEVRGQAEERDMRNKNWEGKERGDE